MSTKDSHQRALEIAAKVMNSTVDRVRYDMKKAGFNFTYSHGRPIFNPTRRIDSYKAESLEPFWVYLPHWVRLYFGAMVYTFDTDSIDNVEKAQCLGMWKVFLLDMPNMGGYVAYATNEEYDKAVQRVLRGAYLYRLGYRHYESQDYSWAIDIPEPKHDLIYREVKTWFTDMGNQKKRLIGLYKIEVEDAPAHSPDLEKVLTDKEASDEYGVDRNIIRQMIYNGQIPARKASSIGIDFLIAREDLEKWFGGDDETDRF